MPFHVPRHHTSLSDSSYAHDNYYSTTNAIYAAGQTLGSVGAPTSHWQPPRQQNLAPEHHQAYNQVNNNTHASNGMNIPYRSAPVPYPSQNALPLDHQQNTQFQTPQRSLIIGHQDRELHLPQLGSAMSDVHHYGAPPSYAGDNLAINLQPSTPQQPSSAQSNAMPGTLQLGQAQRPVMISSSNTAPSLPTLPQITTQMQHPPLSARPTMNSTHSYSRSSPGSMMDAQQKYKPFSNTPEQAKYVSPGGNYMPQTPQGPPSYSPLGLADIRSRGDHILHDIPFSPTTMIEPEPVQYPTNSNYLTPWPIYAVDWCKWPPRQSGSAGKVALGSYMEDNHNYIQVLDASLSQTPDESGERGLEFVKTAEATHAYPVTRILWEPPSSNKQTTDLLATSGDHLRLWSLPADPTASYTNTLSQKSTQPLQKLSPLALLSNSKSPEHTAPITSLDWNVVQPSLIITSSIDTTCTIWDIPTLTAKTQLIAHDKEVYDVRFCANSVDVFVSCGADGSVRMFDLRSLEHSTIIYEPSEKTDKSGKSTYLYLSIASPNFLIGTLSASPLSSSPTRGQPSSSTLAYPPPLLRIAASPFDAHLLATFSSDSSLIRVLDVRQPGQALLELRGHGAPVNCIEWSNTQRGVLASGGDDSVVLLWDLLNSVATQTAPSLPGSVAGGVQQGQVQGGTGQERGPSASWECGFEVSNLSWAPGQQGSQGTLGVCGGRGFYGVQL